MRPGLVAVYAPRGVAELVADGDGEPAEVGPDDLDGGARAALDRQRCVLATVFRQLIRSRQTV